LQGVDVVGKKILVIDDDPSVLGAYRLILDEAGYSVRQAENGLQGIEMAQAERPDLIFLDLKMPGIDGVETLRRLKAMDATLKVYIVTAFSSEYVSQLKAAHDEGLDFQLASKPLSSAQIRNVARSAYEADAPNTENQKLALTLYVVSLNAETRKLVEQFTSVLSTIYAPGQWSFDTVEVLGMPEKALEKDVYATPMLVRDIPEPVLKLLGNLSKMPSVMAAITTEHEGSGTHTMIL